MYELVPVSQETFDEVLDLCIQYAHERDMEWLIDFRTWDGLLTHMCEASTAYVLLRDSVPIGMLLMLEHPHVMNTTKTVLTPLVVYIQKEYRNGWGMHLMLQQIERHAKTVDFSSISLGPEAKVKPETMLKRGYKVLETVYIKEN